MSRGHHFCFTHNNYLDTSLEDNVVCSYIIYGKEVAESGTPHLQGFVSFNSPAQLSTVIKKMLGCHVELCRTPVAAIAYCKKDGDYTERGTPPISLSQHNVKQKEDWKAIREAAEAGDLELVPDHVRVKYCKNLEFIHSQFSRKRKLDDVETPCNLWLYGPTGCGKSRYARSLTEVFYLKMCNKWWDGYDGQDTVIIEDFDVVHSVLCHHMKIWGDRYPFPVEVKGGTRMIRPHRIIVTSNYAPSDIWMLENDLDPILRRYEVKNLGPPANKYASIFNYNNNK